MVTPGVQHLDIRTPDGSRLRVFVEGTGPDILLISGLGGTAAFWAAIAARLGTRHRVIRLDQRGIGSSTRGTAPCTIMQLAEDCLTVLDAVNSARAVVVGHSTGGCIAMMLGGHVPHRVSGLVLSATWARQNRHMQALFDARRVLLEHDPQAYATLACLMAYPPEWLEAHGHVLDTAISRAVTAPADIKVIRERVDALLAFDGQKQLAGLTMPSLVLGAADDLIVPSFLQRELAGSISNSTLRILDSGGHFFPHTQEDWFVASLEAFAAMNP